MEQMGDHPRARNASTETLPTPLSANAATQIQTIAEVKPVEMLVCDIPKAEDKTKNGTTPSDLQAWFESDSTPDGTKFVSQVIEQSGEINLSIWDLTGGTRSRIASGRLTDTPVWSPDGSTLYYAYSPNATPVQIYARPVNGSHPQRLIVASTKADIFPTDVSSDGKWLLYQEIQPTPQLSTLKALSLIGEGQPTVVLDRIDALSSAVLMPGNNNWLAYESSESGQAEIYLTHFPNTGAKYQVSLAGGIQPVWGKDGKRLYYIDISQKLIAADIRTESDSVQVSARTPLVQTNLAPNFDESAYDVTKDGRFLMTDFVIDTPSPLVLVTNWDEESKK